MKLLVCFAALTCVVSSFAENSDKEADIRSLRNDATDAEGNYQYAYETSNGIQFQESGNPAGVRGSLNYISPVGEHIALSYTADEEGYHPIGDHLPTPQPIPVHILRSLEYIRSHPPPQLKQQ